MKYILSLLSIVCIGLSSFSQQNVGLFKFTVKSISDSLINDYRLIVINEKSKDTLIVESETIEQPIKMAQGSYEMFCESGILKAHTVGVVIQANRITFYDFIIENEVTAKRTPTKKRKNKNQKLAYTN